MKILREIERNVTFKFEFVMISILIETSKIFGKKTMCKTDLKLTTHNRNFRTAAVRALKLDFELNANLNYICKVKASSGFFHTLCDIYHTMNLVS